MIRMKSKVARSEPITLRFETGRARLAGHFPDLEDQLCALTWSGYQRAGSPAYTERRVSVASIGFNSA